MLQFIARENNRFSVPELVQMAIEGGCAWVVLDPGEMSDEVIREIAREVIPLCKETSTILTMVDHVDMAKELVSTECCCKTTGGRPPNCESCSGQKP